MNKDSNDLQNAPGAEMLNDKDLQGVNAGADGRIWRACCKKCTYKTGWFKDSNEAIRYFQNNHSEHKYDWGINL